VLGGSEELSAWQPWSVDRWLIPLSAASWSSGCHVFVVNVGRGDDDGAERADGLPTLLVAVQVAGLSQAGTHRTADVPDDPAALPPVNASRRPPPICQDNRKSGTDPEGGPDEPSDDRC
jgi:hypothetical protein